MDREDNGYAMGDLNGKIKDRVTVGINAAFGIMGKKDNGMDN